jgi:hypothetical protein
MDWQAIIAIGALLIAGMAFLSRMFDKSLSIREHEEFRLSIKGDIAQMRADYKRDDDRIEDRVKILEQTRPTTGELDARITAVKGEQK